MSGSGWSDKRFLSPQDFFNSRTLTRDTLHVVGNTGFLQHMMRYFEGGGSDEKAFQEIAKYNSQNEYFLDVMYEVNDYKRSANLQVSSNTAVYFPHMLGQLTFDTLESTLSNVYLYFGSPAREQREVELDDIIASNVKVQMRSSNEYKIDRMTLILDGNGNHRVVDLNDVNLQEVNNLCVDMNGTGDKRIFECMKHGMVRYISMNGDGDKRSISMSGDGDDVYIQMRGRGCERNIEASGRGDNWSIHASGDGCGRSIDFEGDGNDREVHLHGAGKDRKIFIVGSGSNRRVEVGFNRSVQCDMNDQGQNGRFYINYRV